MTELLRTGMVVCIMSALTLVNMPDEPDDSDTKASWPEIADVIDDAAPIPEPQTPSDDDGRIVSPFAESPEPVVIEEESLPAEEPSQPTVEDRVEFPVESPREPMQPASPDDGRIVSPFSQSDDGRIVSPYAEAPKPPSTPPVHTPRTVEGGSGSTGGAVALKSGPVSPYASGPVSPYASSGCRGGAVQASGPVSPYASSVQVFAAGPVSPYAAPVKSGGSTGSVKRVAQSTFQAARQPVVYSTSYERSAPVVQQPVQTFRSSRPVIRSVTINTLRNAECPACDQWIKTEGAILRSQNIPVIKNPVIGPGQGSAPTFSVQDSTGRTIKFSRYTSAANIIAAVSR